MYTFELLRADARRVVVLTQEEIERSGSSSATTEYLLIGLALAEGPAQEVLSGFGIDADAVRARFTIVPGTDRIRRAVIPASRFGEVIRFGYEVARKLSSDSVGGEHLLLALLTDGESRAARFLEGAGAGLDPVCQRLGIDVDAMRATPRPA